MSSPSRTKQKNQETLSGKTQIIVVGLVIAIIGSAIAGSYPKATMINYAGFGMLLGGVSVLIFGSCATACTSVDNKLCQSSSKKTARPRILFSGIWAIGVGLVLCTVGPLLSSSYAKSSMVNTVGFGMLLTGICFFVLGIFGTLLGTMQTSLDRNRRQFGLSVDRPSFLSYSILSIGVGLILIIVGSIVAGSYAKETVINYAGFGMLLIGIAVLTLGMSGTSVTIVKSTWGLNESLDAEALPILGSFWAIGIGIMLIINGSLIASSYAKTSLMNYSGFGMLLSGTAVFVYGLFETARFSTMGYLSGKWAGNREQRENLPRLKNFWVNMLKTTAIFNLTGVMIAMGLLFFSLWQLDLIVSGPVWWQSSSNGAGWSWPGPGAYAKEYFQCFIWKTTIGQAYDTLFMLIFIAFIILFASAFFWPRSTARNKNSIRAPKHRSTSRNSKNNARAKNTKETPENPITSQEDNNDAGGT
ncbi:MAG TPA: hypothetical protein VK536_04530 [Candidatus Limnocylindrales bacterium]|nr:hypothetical protein [Candidatus Limnocylindrales bacterium]